MIFQLCRGDDNNLRETTERFTDPMTGGARLSAICPAN
jgi:hypothetical protein